jgi:CubicO group peptidase (beta-lactamase class C family)
MAGHLHIPALDPGESVPSSLSRPVIDSLLRNDMGFNGLVFTDALGMKGITNHFKPADAAEMALNAGNDILLMPENVPGVIRHLTNLVKQGKISADEIDKRCGKVLAAKYRAGLSHYEPVVMEHLLEDLNRPEYMMLQRKLIESSLTALQNDRDILPLQRLDTLRIATVALGEKEDTVFQHTLFNYAPVDHFYLKGDSLDPVDSIFNSLKKYNLIIISIHANLANTTAPYGIVPGITELADSLFLLPNVVLDLFASPYALSNFTNTGHLSAILLSYENTSLIQDLSGQVIFGAIGTSGTIPVSVLQWKAHETGIALPESGRLKFTIPYEAGIRQDLPAKVDSMINAAMEAQVFPGCQVLVARNGKVVINKAYGTPIYKSNLSVKPTDIYDLASITKAAATTLAVMRLTDENKLDITKKLSAYLPSLNGTNVKDITIRDILLHQSGLPPGLQYYLPVLEPVFNDQTLLSQQLTETHPMRIGNNQYINKFTRYKTGIIVPEGSDEYPYQVADQMFILKSWPDSLFYRIANSKVQQKKEYLYSDLGFILLGQLIDSITGMPENRYLDSVFYRGLGADRLGFMPLKRFPKAEIMPTEEDQIFRKQLIHGYVHDPGAAMLGGVSGHAGLFGNALDLAKVMQMLLNKGEYAGKRYINSATVEAFTMNPMGVSGNRRGLGFDKPEPDTTKTGPSCAGASLLSFGHSGFTGTFIWADPAFDLIYVFLSNRVYPDAGNNKLVDMNIRTDIQQAVYDAILEE